LQGKKIILEEDMDRRLEFFDKLTGSMQRLVKAVR
jgi:hypothetical protein